MLSGSAVANALSIGWDSADLSKFPPAYAASLAKQIGISFTPTGSVMIAQVPTGMPSARTSSFLPSETDGQSSGLTSGTKAGIGIGAVAGAVAIIGLGILALCFRRRRRRSVGHTPNDNLPEMIVDQNRTSKITVGEDADGSWSRSRS